MRRRQHVDVAQRCRTPPIRPMRRCATYRRGYSGPALRPSSSPCRQGPADTFSDLKVWHFGRRYRRLDLQRLHWFASCRFQAKMVRIPLDSRKLLRKKLAATLHESPIARLLPREHMSASKEQAAQAPYPAALHAGGCGGSRNTPFRGSRTLAKNSHLPLSRLEISPPRRFGRLKFHRDFSACPNTSLGHDSDRQPCRWRRFAQYHARMLASRGTSGQT